MAGAFNAALQFSTSSEQPKKKKKRNYDPDQIVLAYKAVKEDGMSVYKAARVYGIPESTLRDRSLGLQPVDYLPCTGTHTVLTKEEEKSIVEHATYMFSLGYGYSRKSFLDMAFECAIILGKKSPDDPVFTGSWLEGFRKRWPELQFKKPMKLSSAKAKATSEEPLDKHFSDLTDTIEELQLDKYPERIWNVYASELLIGHCLNCVKRASSEANTSQRGKNVTLIGCGSAAGRFVPPYFIFPGKKWSDELLNNTCEGSSGEMSETGSSNAVTFQNYMANHFLKHVKIAKGKPHLVIVDGHTSRLSLTLTDWGKDHGIEFYVLPPHTSHLTQPLDVTCFGPLKAMYNIECVTHVQQNPEHKVSRYVVGELSSKAYLKAFTPTNLKNSFRRTGIHPLDREAMNETKIMPSVTYHISE